MAGCHDKSQAISSLAGPLFPAAAAIRFLLSHRTRVQSSARTGSFAEVASHSKRVSAFNEAPGRPDWRVIPNFPDAIDVTKWRLDAQTAGAGFLAPLTRRWLTAGR